MVTLSLPCPRCGQTASHTPRQTDHKGDATRDSHVHVNPGLIELACVNGHRWRTRLEFVLEAVR